MVDHRRRWAKSVGEIPWPEKRNAPCKFFNGGLGFCFKGENCDFLHHNLANPGDPPADKGGRFSRSQILPENLKKSIGPRLSSEVLTTLNLKVERACAFWDVVSLCVKEKISLDVLFKESRDFGLLHIIPALASSLQTQYPDFTCNLMLRMDTEFDNQKKSKTEKRTSHLHEKPVVGSNEKVITEQACPSQGCGKIPTEFDNQKKSKTEKRTSHLHEKPVVRSNEKVITEQACPSQGCGKIPEGEDDVSWWMQTVDLVKASGNEYFKKQDYMMALKKYREALRYLDVCWEKEGIDQETRSALRKTKSQIFTNSAACKLKFGDANGALQDTKSAMSYEHYNVQALLLQGQAYMALHNVEAADECLEKALNIEPNDDCHKRQ